MDELTLVDVAMQSPQFALRVTSRRVLYQRLKFTGGTAQTEAMLHGVSDVRIRKLWPIGVSIFCAIVLSGFAVAVALANPIPARVFWMPVIALFAWLGGGTRRRQLSFVSVGKRYVITEPRTINPAIRARVRAALTDTARLLADPAALEAAVRERVAQLPSAAPDERADDGERRLCPDGACTGLVGSDGVCKVCGKSAA
jgi:hypothetical protein